MLWWYINLHNDADTIIYTVDNIARKIYAAGIGALNSLFCPSVSSNNLPIRGSFLIYAI